MSVKLLTKHHSEILSLKEGCTGLSESTLVKMPHCWKSHVTAQITKYYECRSLYRLSIYCTPINFREQFMFLAFCKEEKYAKINRR